MDSSRGENQTSIQSTASSNHDESPMRCVPIVSRSERELGSGTASREIPTRTRPVTLVVAGGGNDINSNQQGSCICRISYTYICGKSCYIYVTLIYSYHASNYFCIYFCVYAKTVFYVVIKNVTTFDALLDQTFQNYL